ncbi:MAG TPA: DivIVA domain-containing protein [Kineosporiaceae bacterium]|nr:DivIVA domain-containing protein [Kineosporiaceae bacterium]
MTLLFTLLTLAVLGVIAAVATGRISGGLEDPSTSLPARALPEGEVTASSLEVVRFSPALRGYRMDEVDAVLDRVAVELARRDRELVQLRQELRLAEQAYRGHYPAVDYQDRATGSLPFPGPDSAGHQGGYPGAGYAVPGDSGGYGVYGQEYEGYGPEDGDYPNGAVGYPYPVDQGHRDR